MPSASTSNGGGGMAVYSDTLYGLAGAHEILGECLMCAAIGDAQQLCLQLLGQEMA